jgi:hypothetical protein
MKFDSILRTFFRIKYFYNFNVNNVQLLDYFYTFISYKINLKCL